MSEILNIYVYIYIKHNVCYIYRVSSDFRFGSFIWWVSVWYAFNPNLKYFGFKNKNPDLNPKNWVP